MVKNSDIKWNNLFHETVNDILAPRGYESHYSGELVAKLQYLTEARVKKVANACKRVMDLFEKQIQLEFYNRRTAALNEKEEIEIQLKKEYKQWFFLRNYNRIAELEERHYNAHLRATILSELEAKIADLPPL